MNEFRCEHAQGTRWDSDVGPGRHLVCCINCYYPLDLIEDGDWVEGPLEDRDDWADLCAATGWSA